MKKYLVKSPIDGFVSKVPVNDYELILEASESSALNSFNDIGKHLGLDNMVDSNINMDSTPIVIVVPVNMKLSRAIEQKKIESAEERLKIANDRLSKELKLNDKTKLHARGRRLHQEYIAKSSSNNNISHEGVMTAQRGEELFNIWRDFSLNNSMPSEVSAAQTELEASQLSLALLDANAKLGEVCIPFQTRILDCFVYKGQYVNKGDLLIEIEKIN